MPDAITARMIKTGIHRMLRATIFLSLLLGPAAAAEPATTGPADALLAHMTGHWVLSGTIEGQNTVHDVEADWVLNGYIRLHEVSREKTPQGSPAYEAIVFIARQPSPEAGPKAATNNQSGQYVCFWLDNTVISGPNSPGTATASGNSLPFTFAGGSFLNTMTYLPATDSWHWQMDGVDKAGTKSPFAALTLTRAPAREK
ncbi:MAG: hypothetical protein WCD42_14645 [Rhizomicrobium sp.]